MRLSTFVAVCLSFTSTFAFASACSSAAPTDQADPLPDRRPVDDDDGGGVLRVFATSTTTNGRFNGLAGADAICATQAQAGGLSGTFVAWLSVENGPHAIDRVTSSGPWRLVSGEIVASTKTELVGGAIQHAIELSELERARASSCP